MFIKTAVYTLSNVVYTLGNKVVHVLYLSFNYYNNSNVRVFNDKH